MKKDKLGILDRLIKEAENYTPKPRKKESTEFQLGVMIGEYIVLRYLPVLNISILKTNNVINVSEEDRLKYEMLDNIYRNKSNYGKNNAKDEWFNLLSFDHELEKKYLPHILECNLHYLIDVENIIDLKAGIKCSLWDCDVCCYKIEPDDIIIENFHDITTVIKLTLDIDREIRY